MKLRSSKHVVFLGQEYLLLLYFNYIFDDVNYFIAESLSNQFSVFFNPLVTEAYFQNNAHVVEFFFSEFNHTMLQVISKKCLENSRLKIVLLLKFA